ncbi:MAG: hypothetical protein MUC59_09760 [Saprospiraceae bacterium]|nr:hypothetical protein [Saprospiraceae bacterium]
MYLLKSAHLGVKFTLPLLLTTVLFVACDREDEPIPTYMTIEPFELKATDTNKHGSISENITHADVFMFDSTTNESIQLGVFELPATFPVLNSGNFSLNIDPVIRANGSSNYLQPYPFYSRFSKNINLSNDEGLTVKPSTNYIEEAVFGMQEDFENGNTVFTVDRDDNDATAVTITSQDAFEGQYSGRIKLDTANAVIVAQTEGLFDLTISTAGKIYLELNYKTDVPLEFGIIPVEDNGLEGTANFEFVVLAKDRWNKIYFDLTEVISITGGLRFAIIMRAGIPLREGKYTLDEAEILLDNIKLVHF